VEPIGAPRDGADHSWQVALATAIASENACGSFTRRVPLPGRFGQIIHGQVEAAGESGRGAAQGAGIILPVLSLAYSGDVRELSCW